MPALWTAEKRVSFFAGLVLFFCLLANLAYAAAVPTLGTISPASGSVAPSAYTTFTCTYSDADGWTNLKEAYLLISQNSATLTNSAYLYYDQNSNLMYLRNDANTAWIGGYAPGSSYYIENSQAKVWCAFSSASGTGTTLTVKFYLSFKTVYSGKSYNSYLKATDDSSNTAAWLQKGTYKVNYKPAIGGLSPFSGTLQTATPINFITTQTDFDGWQQLQEVYLLINTSTAGANCVYAYYNQNTNQLFLRNDTDTAWLGGYTPGSVYTIENSYAKLDCLKSSISPSNTILGINWNITFKNNFTGVKNIYLYVKDDLDEFEGWLQKGSITITKNNTSVVICTLNPADKSTFTETDVIPVYACSYSAGANSIEFQVSVEGAIIKPWVSSLAACTCNGSGISFSYNWQTKIGDKGNRTIKVEARNSVMGTISKETKVYIFRKAAGPPP